MLGLFGLKQKWEWAGFGKHPIVKDYFHVGRDHSLLSAFLDWVKKGYDEITIKDYKHPDLYSWRFWARVPKRENLICGLIRDSSDNIGRPYPFMIIGTGPLKGWEENWDMLPFACEGVWKQSEFLSSSNCRDVGELENEIIRIKHPENNWEDFVKEREAFWDTRLSPASASLGILEERIRRASEQLEIIVSLDDETLKDQFFQVCLWHYYLKRYSKNIPNAIFMGGTMQKTFLVTLRRPLQSSDFVLLWSINLEKEDNDGSITTW